MPKKNSIASSKGINIVARARPRLKVQPRRPRGRPKAEDVEAIETRLILVARQAFSRNGYGATSLNSIAKSARASKTTFYARFPSKAALFRAIIERQIAGVVEELPPAVAGNDDSLEDKLRGYFNLTLRRSLSGDVLDINRLILSESHQFPELGQAAQARFEVGVQRVATFIEDSARQDRIACRNAASAAALILSAVNGWYMSIMITNRVVTDRERMKWVDNAVRIFMASRPEW
jgi:AcrR family transcriptional regulator